MPTSSPHRKNTWFETQKRRKKNPFFRLLKRSFSFRLLIASLISLGILGLVHRFEICHQAQFSKECLTTTLGDVISVGNVESFSIVTAAWMYILESSKRIQQSNLEALELVNTNQGITHSIGRIEALEMTAERGLYFDHLNLEGCNLEQLEIPYTRLRYVKLARSVLKGADLRYTDLWSADLSQTDLTGANLTGADLSQANLTGANLTGANLTGANLTGANLTGANLEGVDLTLAHLENTLLLASNSSSSHKT